MFLTLILNSRFFVHILNLKFKDTVLIGYMIKLSVHIILKLNYKNSVLQCFFTMMLFVVRDIEFNTKEHFLKRVSLNIWQPINI